MTVPKWPAPSRCVCARYGPKPHALWPRGAVTELRLRDVHGEDKVLLQSLVSYRRTLLRLDVSGMGDVVLPVLLAVGLEQLQLLRCGDTFDSAGHSAERRSEWPRGVTIAHVGAACPALTALDVGFASIDGGVQVEHQQVRVLIDLEQHVAHEHVAVLRARAAQLHIDDDERLRLLVAILRRDRHR